MCLFPVNCQPEPQNQEAVETGILDLIICFMFCVKQSFILTKQIPKLSEQGLFKRRLASIYLSLGKLSVFQVNSRAQRKQDSHGGIFYLPNIQVYNSSRGYPMITLHTKGNRMEILVQGLRCECTH